MKKLIFLLPLLILALAVSIFAVRTNSSTISSSQLGCVPVADETALIDQYDVSATTGEYLGKVVQVPAVSETLAYVLGDQDQVGAKRIEVSIANQRVYGFDGNNKVFDFVVSTGKWYATPKGNFTVERKVRRQKMSGGSREKGTYYYLPNVQWVMFFGNKQIPWWRGFSFHGTYWHNNFGTPMSHGCVNMKTPEAEQLFNWAPVGTPVVIY